MPLASISAGSDGVPRSKLVAGQELGAHPRRRLGSGTRSGAKTSALIRSPSPWIAAFPAAEIGIAVVPEFRVQLALVPRGMPHDRDQGQAAWQARIGAQNSWAP